MVTNIDSIHEREIKIVDLIWYDVNKCFAPSETTTDVARNNTTTIYIVNLTCIDVDRTSREDTTTIRDDHNRVNNADVVSLVDDGGTDRVAFQ